MSRRNSRDAKRQRREERAAATTVLPHGAATGIDREVESLLDEIVHLTFPEAKWGFNIFGPDVQRVSASPVKESIQFMSCWFFEPLPAAATTTHINEQQRIICVYRPGCGDDECFIEAFLEGGNKGSLCLSGTIAFMREHLAAVRDTSMTVKVSA